LAAAEKATAGAFAGLGTRALVGAGLAVLAIAATVRGGLAFLLLVAAGALLVLREWAAIHSLGRGQLLVGLALLGLACLLAHLGRAPEALLLLAVGAGVAAIFALTFAGRARGFLFTGLLYAGLPAVALLWLRGEDKGAALVLWVMGIVWATDVAAYFAGRAIGGPRLAPRLSPKKTWAGLAGGVLAAALASLAWGQALGWGAPLPALALAGAGLALLAQAGDLYESWLKRRVGLKDSGRLLPGHGGLMDRVDGLVPVSAVAGFLVAAFGSPA